MYSHFCVQNRQNSQYIYQDHMKYETLRNKHIESIRKTRFLVIRIYTSLGQRINDSRIEFRCILS
jgi:hypothetical protein